MQRSAAAKANGNKAVFLDRDGVINEIVYHADLGIVDSPFVAKQLRLLPKAGEAIRLLNQAAFRVVVVTNQPGVAKMHFTRAALAAMHRRLQRLLRAYHAHVDAIYCCLHHPQARLKSLRRVCACRKPAPGMLVQAARDFALDRRRVFMVGDGLTDIEAGKTAGCKTILVGGAKCDTCQLMRKKNLRPDAVVPSLWEAALLITKGKKRNGSRPR